MLFSAVLWNTSPTPNYSCSGTLFSVSPFLSSRTVFINWAQWSSSINTTICYPIPVYVNSRLTKCPGSVWVETNIYLFVSSVPNSFYFTGTRVWGVLTHRPTDVVHSVEFVVFTIVYYTLQILTIVFFLYFFINNDMICLISEKKDILKSSYFYLIIRVPKQGSIRLNDLPLPTLTKLPTTRGDEVKKLCLVRIEY